MKILKYEDMKILKYQSIKTIRQILQIKWENVFLPLAIPCLISQMINAQEGMKMIAIVMILLLFGAVYYGTLTTRREFLQEVKEEEKELKKELACIKKRSYSSNRIFIVDQNYKHSFLLSR